MEHLGYNAVLWSNGELQTPTLHPESNVSCVCKVKDKTLQTPRIRETDFKDWKLHVHVIAWLYFLRYLMTCVIQSTFCCENPWEVSDGSLCITTDPGSTNISRSPLDGSSIRMGSPPPISTVRLIFLNCN